MSDITTTQAARAAANLKLALRRHFKGAQATFDVLQNGDGTANYTYTVTTNVTDPPTLDRFRDFAAGFLAGRPTAKSKEIKAEEMTAKIHFTTNLDEAKPYVWKLAESWKGPVPGLNHSIVFDFERWNHDLKRLETLHFSLIVVEVRWGTAGEPTVELHAPRHFTSIKDWMNYFRIHVKGATHL